MRLLVLSDIHANRRALEAVLAEAGPCEAVALLGDVVGYGPHPNEVVDLLRALPHLHAVRGNHDRAALDGVRGDFNDEAWAAIGWTRATLSEASVRFLRSIPAGPQRFGGVCLCHGSPVDEDAYVLGGESVRRACEGNDSTVMLFGHTHVAAAYRVEEGQVAGRLIRDPTTVEYDSRGQWLFNPGSVGQPRDGCPDAAYARLDLQLRTVAFGRVAHDVASTQRAMRRAGLADSLVERIALGS